MAAHNQNYEVISLSGTQNTSIHGDGWTASTTHQIYCLSTGTITITPSAGPSFTWSATTNTYMDVMVRQTVVNSGTFIGFKGKSYFYAV